MGAVTIMTGFPYIPGLMPEYYLAVGSICSLLYPVPIKSALPGMQALKIMYDHNG